MTAPVLEFVNIRKSFFGIEVLKGINLGFESGEVHGILGQNGAGKSTLIKILTGVYGHSGGQIKLNGEAVELSDPLHANKLGIGAVHQEPELVRGFNVAQNIVLGNEPNGVFISRSAILAQGRAILEEMGIDLDPAAPASSLSAAESQLVMLATLLHRKYRVVVLDEPTARLSIKETQVLFEIVERFKKRGVTILYISHRLNEIQELCDRATVLRDGVVTGTLAKEEINEEIVTRLMIDRNSSDLVVENPGHKTDEVALELQHVSTGRLQPISFKIHKGEVLGLIGPVGSGVEQIERCLGGLTKYAGDILINGKVAKISSPVAALSAGIALIPEERRKKAIFPNMTAAENISMPVLHKLSRFGFVTGSSIIKNAASIINELQIIPRNPGIPIRYFSGGNQQKAVVGKWMQERSDIYVFVEPTAGVDVGAIEGIYRLILSLASSGAAVVLVSTSVKEILSLSETVGVVHHGVLTKLAPRSEFTSDSLLALSMAPTKAEPKPAAA
nr:sugar ABC transporter ATP-binding protein [uncultured Devosia sp.]